MMRTLMLAAAAVLSFGGGFAHAGDGGDDGGTIPITFFTELSGVDAQLGEQHNNVAANQHNAPATAYRTVERRSWRLAL
jgi:hypothetical protein